MKRKHVLNLFRDHIPPSNLITRPAAVKPFETDGLTAIREVPWAVVLPETEEQVVDVLRICRENGVPVVPRGAGTGLSGGARPQRNGVVLGLSKMNRILEIDLDNCVAVVQPGVRNLAISDAVSAHKLFYAPDPSSQIACSIGGNVAENAGGAHCLKYGVTVNNIVGLRVQTITGECLALGGKRLDSPGMGLLAVLTGSEGMLGVVTEITVRLLPVPETRAVLLAAFDDVVSASEAVASIIGGGLIPAALEMMDRLAIRGAEAYCCAGYPDCEAILICEVDGVAAEVAAAQELVQRVFEQNDALEVRIATDDKEQQRLWAGRKAAFPAMGRIASDYYCVDGTIPRRALPEVLVCIRSLGAEYGLAVANVFHAGDGNLHPMILYDASFDGAVERAEELGGKILELCVTSGGTVTGEHGVGLEKIDQMCSQFSAAELSQFHRLKEAFDPVGLMNPGKAVPTLTRCVEVGGMHVHDGKLPYSALERF
ncbi:MAG: FAD-linked oxidase C-terminal domain-containing protein [Woeseia sp.]